MQYLVWDFDGTLGYRSGGWSGALVDVARNHEPGVEIKTEDAFPHLEAGFPWHTPDQPHTDISTADEWWEQLSPVFVEAVEANGVETGRARQLAKRVRPTYVENDWTVFDDTIPTLARRSSMGWTNLVLSNHVPELTSILQELGVSDHVEDVYVSAEIGYEKPHPEAFPPIVSAIEDDATAWMIGDSYRADVRGASAVGLPAVHVRGTHPDADYSCKTLSTIDDVLDDQ